MMSLLPPSPAPSQIDTTFQRRERVEPSTERVADDCFCSDETEHVQKPEDARHVDEEESSDDQSNETIGTADFATLLSLVSQPRPHKKHVDSDVLPEATSAQSSTDDDATQILMAAVQWMIPQPQTARNDSPTASTSNVLANIDLTKTSTATQKTNEGISLVSQQAVLAEAIESTDSSTSTAASLTDTAISQVESKPAEAPATTTALPIETSQEVASVQIESSLEETLELPVEIISQNSKVSSVSATAPSPQLETVFETTLDQASSAAAVLPESDEITREIERLIFARPTQTLSRSASSEFRASLETVTSEIVAGVDAPLRVVHNADAQGFNDAVVTTAEKDQLQPLPGHTRSEQQSLSEQSDEGGAQNHAASASQGKTATAGWPSNSTVSSDFAMTTRAEFQEPLSSQTARAIVQHYETRESNDNESLTVRLDPPELGELTIELSQTREGLAVRVTAREAVTMEMLLSRGHEIEQHLKSQNVDVATMEFLSSGMMNQQSSRQNGSRDSNNELMIESARRQSSLQSSAEVRRDATTVRDASRSLSFRA